MAKRSVKTKRKMKEARRNRVVSAPSVKVANPGKTSTAPRLSETEQEIRYFL